MRLAVLTLAAFVPLCGTAQAERLRVADARHATLLVATDWATFVGSDNSKARVRVRNCERVTAPHVRCRVRVRTNIQTRRFPAHVRTADADNLTVYFGLMRCKVAVRPSG